MIAAADAARVRRVSKCDDVGEVERNEAWVGSLTLQVWPESLRKGPGCTPRCCCHCDARKVWRRRRDPRICRTREALRGSRAASNRVEDLSEHHTWARIVCPQAIDLQLCLIELLDPSEGTRKSESMVD